MNVRTERQTDHTNLCTYVGLAQVRPNYFELWYVRICTDFCSANIVYLYAGLTNDSLSPCNSSKEQPRKQSQLSYHKVKGRTRVRSRDTLHAYTINYLSYYTPPPLH